MKRLCSSPLEPPSPKHQKVEGCGLINLPNDLLQSIARIIFRGYRYQFEILDLGLVSHRFKTIIESDNAIRWISYEKKMLVAMKKGESTWLEREIAQNPYFDKMHPEFSKSSFAYANMLLHTPSREKEAFDVLSEEFHSEVLVAFRREVIKKEIADGHLGKARSNCEQELDHILLFKIDYIQNKKNQAKSAVEFFREKLMDSSMQEKSCEYWPLMAKWNPEAAFTVFEEIVLDQKNRRFLLQFPSSLFSYNLKRSYELCLSVSAKLLEIFIEEVMCRLSAENHYRCLNEIGISPAQFMELMIKTNDWGESDDRFYKLADIFIKTHTREEILALAVDVRKIIFSNNKEDWIYFLFFLHASVDPISFEFFVRDMLKSERIHEDEIDFFNKLTACFDSNSNMQENLRALYQTRQTEWILAVKPYLITLREHPLMELITYPEMYHTILENQPDMIFPPDKMEIIRKRVIKHTDLLGLVAAIDMDQAVSLLENPSLGNYTVGGVFCLNVEEQSRIKDVPSISQFLGAMSMADYFIRYPLPGNTHIKRIGNILIESEALYEMILLAKVRSDLLRVFKWCEQNGIFLMDKFLGKIEGVANERNDRKLYFWLAEEARNFLKGEVKLY